MIDGSAFVDLSSCAGSTTALREQGAEAESPQAELVDAFVKTLPIRTPQSSECFTTHGFLDGPSAVTSTRIAMPPNCVVDESGVVVELSHTKLQQLRGVALWLKEYPYSCVEQRALKVLCIASFSKPLALMGIAGLANPSECAAFVSELAEKLWSCQQDNGAFGFWGRTSSQSPVVTAHVALSIHAAIKADFEVPEDLVTKIVKWCREVPALVTVREGTTNVFFKDSYYYFDTKMFMVCQALYAGILLGADHPLVYEKAAIKLMELASEHAGGGPGESLNLSALHPESLALLALVLTEAKQQHLDNVWTTVADPDDVASIEAKIIACGEQRTVLEASSELPALKEVGWCVCVLRVTEWHGR